MQTLPRFGVVHLLWLTSIMAAATASAAELVRLSDENWDEFAPQGKEVDAIYGDYVLRNDQIVAVVANPIPTRNANMTVKNVGGAIIDLTRRDHQSDQLSAFYPLAARYAFTAATSTTKKLESDKVEFACLAPAGENTCQVKVRYELADGQPFVLVETTFTNSQTKAIEVDLVDAVRADRSFEMDIDEDRNLFWAHDDWWRQAYGIVPERHAIAADGNSVKSKRPLLRYTVDGKSQVAIQPGKSYTLTRRVFPAGDVIAVKAIASELSGRQSSDVNLAVRDAAGPIDGAKIVVGSLGSARTGRDGRLSLSLPPGKHSLTISALGRPDEEFEIDARQVAEATVDMEQPGYVIAEIQDADGKPIPCKVEFRGQGDLPSPFFGPDTFEHAVHNLYYSHNGRFRQELGPGKYDVIVSHGPEYDAVFTEIEVRRGQESRLEAVLARSVETGGWISSDFHSHSSPSGDNVSSQRGRVLNLLAEHIEFAPCTEHNRVSSYLPHLKALNTEHFMATCSGMELTGSPLPINHQNAFPLIRRPRTQDGGGPQTDLDPLVQIERLALWDDGAEKLVQENHPHIVQILGDRDVDGRADGGFEKMFGLMDVIEVHPPGAIFSKPQQLSKTNRDRGNAIFHWMQLLNLGYRVPGVVNTDAHYNFHGSGWLRNYLESPTDDPAKIETLDMVHAAEHGHVIMTNGPFLEVEAAAGGGGQKSKGTAGDDVVASDGKLTLSIRVQCPNWFDINRVQVFLNGQPAEDLNFTRKTANDRFGETAVRFAHSIPLELKSDTHLIVAAAGEGLTLGSVMGPDRGQAMPVAVSNPIFVDTDGNGFEANGDMLGLPLPIPVGHKPSHPHSHD